MIFGKGEGKSGGLVVVAERIFVSWLDNLLEKAKGSYVSKAVDEMLRVEFDVDKDVQHRDTTFLDGNQARVAIVDEKITAEGSGGKVIDATRAKRDVAEDHRLDSVAVPLKDV